MSTNDWSVPKTEVFGRIRTALENDHDAVLATVIAVEGSAYRRPGAKMLIRPDGGGAGSITAGCLEDEVRALASDVLTDGSPRVETWDLTGDNDVWGMGVGCNGVITVLLEPLDASYRRVASALEHGEDILVATIVDGDRSVGTRNVYHPDSGFESDIFPDWLADRLVDPATRLLTNGQSDTLIVDSDEGTVEVFLDSIRAPPKLVVFGSGHDIEPVVELAKLVDFHVSVVTFRGAKAAPDRFPGADEVVSTSPGDVADLREWDADTYAVVMTHNFVDDRLALDELLATPVPYIGLMGPRDRFDEMREEFAAEGRTFTKAELDRIYTPIGLNLGGDTPYQIAYSIVGELLAVTNDRTPQHLSNHEGPIHDRVDLTTE